MKAKMIAKICVDIGMMIALLLLMPYELVGQAAHEWLGIGIFVLFIVHHILNRKWSRNVGKGCATILREEFSCPQIYEQGHDQLDFSWQKWDLDIWRYIMVELTYARVIDCFFPDLVLDEPEPVRTVGKYGSLRRTYLKQHKHDLWREPAGNRTLTNRLLRIDKTTIEWRDSCRR